MLDHDLTDSAITEADHDLSSTDLLPLLATGLRRWTPVLIHSHNPGKATNMHRFLETAGMEVTVNRLASLTKAIFEDWLLEVRAS